MNLRFLATVVAFSKHQTLNAAAQTLGLSHSAVSLQIKALEEELQFPILDRSKRPPMLTSQGHALVEHAKRMEGIAGDIRALADGSSLYSRVAGATVSVSDHVMRQHRAEPLCSLTFAIRHDLCNQATVIVVEHRLWHRAKERKRVNMPIQPSLGVRGRIGTDILRKLQCQVPG